jgi:UDP-glucose 4-epimerase
LESPATGIFNVAGGQAITIQALVEGIRQQANSRSEIVRAPGRAGDVKHSLADVSKTRAAGFATTCDFQASLKTTIGWHQTVPAQLEVEVG